MSWLTSIKPALVLTLIAFIGLSVLSGLQQNTRDRVAANEREYKSRQLQTLLSSINYTNQPWEEPIALPDEDATIYPVKLDETLVANVIEIGNTQGYVGAIRLLTAVSMNSGQAERIIGVSVAAHQETPGLGDKIDVAKSDWILQFSDQEIATADSPAWAIRKDQGEFDQITGATVTSRAVISGVKDALGILQRSNATDAATN